MKHRFLSIVLAIALSFSLFPVTAFADPGFSNFHQVNTYNGQFTDVIAGSWYAESVASAYRLGLVAGKSPTSFKPDDNLKLCEVIALACSLHSTYYGQAVPDASGGPWYQKYVDYALSNGILTAAYADYERSAKRFECVAILANSLPAEGFAEINNIENGAIPDVSMSASYAAPVYKFYRAGIMQGYAEGAFRPNNDIRRCEIAATLLRIADPSIRGTFTLEPVKDLTADKIAEKCANAVFYIEVYDANGTCTGSGSGFFLDAAGTAITNYHVIKGAHSAKILLTNGNVYDVAGVYDYNASRDTALLKINGSGFEYLALADSDAVVAGQTVFAIGSPQGLDNSISQGIISNVRRWVDDGYFIQTTAQISPGSSGGALLNARGEAVGITSAYINLEGSQNLNLAIPINDIRSLSKNTVVTLASIAGAESPQHTPTGSYDIEIDYSSLTMPVNSGFDMGIYADGVFDTIYYYTEDTSIVDCKWGEWEDDYNIPLSLFSGRAGRTTITISLLDEASNELFRKSFTVTVTDRTYGGKLTLSTSSVNVQPNQTTSVTVTEKASDSATLHWENSNPGVVSCEWGEWSGDSLPLKITGLSAGTAFIDVDVYDGNAYAGTQRITVSVGSVSTGSVYNYLVDYTRRNGIYMGEDNSYIHQFDRTSDSDSSTYCFTIYDASKQMLTLAMRNYFGDIERDVFLDIPSSLSGSYTVMLGSKYSGLDYSGLATVNAATYTDTTKLYFSNYTGPSSVEASDRDLLAAELNLLLAKTGVLVLLPAGYTLQDLGFRSFR